MLFTSCEPERSCRECVAGVSKLNAQDLELELPVLYGKFVIMSTTSMKTKDHVILRLTHV